MKTKIKNILRYNPYNSGVNKYLKHYGIKREDIDENQDIELLDILNVCGVEDAYWCLRSFDYDDYCLMLADVAKSVLYIFEDKHPNDKRPREAIRAIRDYKAGKISREELKKYSTAAATAAYDDTVAAAYDAAYAAAYDAAYATAAAAAYDAAYATAYDAAVAAAVAYADTANYAAAVGSASYAAAKQWVINEQIMRKHL